ncbi:hypothetical protein CHUAL_003833 [Chamberlinius hualienensis]
MLWVRVGWWYKAFNGEEREKGGKNVSHNCRCQATKRHNCQRCLVTSSSGSVANPPRTPFLGGDSYSLGFMISLDSQIVLALILSRLLLKDTTTSGGQPLLKIINLFHLITEEHNEERKREMDAWDKTSGGLCCDVTIVLLDLKEEKKRPDPL